MFEVIFWLKEQLLSFVVNTAFSQVYVSQGGCGIKYDYDAAGNRIKRKLHCWGVPPLPNRPANNDSSKLIATDKLTMQVYPNPTHDVFNVTFSTQVSNATITLQDATGKIIQQKAANGSQVAFDVATLASGNYFIIYSNPKSKQKLIRKLSKQ